MRFRKLRIAWSVGCGLACVLLIALWVRSANSFDDFGWGISAQGKLYMSPILKLVPITEREASIETDEHFGGMVKTLTVRNVQIIPSSGTGGVIPYWLPALVL